MQVNRLDSGGRIDRSKPLSFEFDGRKLQGYAGDTLASALLANGVDIVGRSFKYGRPRGIVGHGAEEPNAIVQLGQGAATVPNIRATQAELYDGMQAYSVGGWPSAEFDAFGFFKNLFGSMTPPGFYYKTFMWPRKFWMLYEHFIRKAAGLGSAPLEADPDSYDKVNQHADVLVVGGGPAGLMAALRAGQAGARVIIADEQNELGGSLLASRHSIDGTPAAEWLRNMLASLGALPNVQLLPRSTVFGYYDQNFLAIAERRTDHIGLRAKGEARQCVHRVRVGRRRDRHEHLGGGH